MDQNKELKNKDILEDLERIMYEEVVYYSDRDKPVDTKMQKRLIVTDRMVKSASVIMAIENLKERRFMNRTERKSELRKTNSLNKE